MLPAQTYIRSLPGKPFRLCLLAALLCLHACVNYHYSAEPIDPAHFLENQLALSVDAPEFQQFHQRFLPLTNWPLQRWQFDNLALAQLYFHPDINVAIQTIPVEQSKQIIAQQRINPQLNIPLEHHSDTSDGKSPWLIGLLLDFVYERQGKRQARIDQAANQALMTQMDVQIIAADLQKRLHMAYLEHFAAKQGLEILRNEKTILEQVIHVLEQRLDAGETNQFEISVTRLETQKNLLALARQQARVTESYVKLAAMLGINPDKFIGRDIEFANQWSSTERYELTRPEIRQDMLQNRLDVQKALIEYQVFEAALRYQIEKQYPDITLSPGFIFDQDDKIWTLGTAWLLPLLHNNDGQIEQALAERRLMQQRFLQLQSQIINQLNLLWSGYETSVDAHDQALVLMNSAKQNFSNLEKQYELGYVDRIEYLRGKRELNRLEHSVFELKNDIIRSYFAMRSYMTGNPGLKFNTEEAVTTLIGERLEDSEKRQ